MAPIPDSVRAIRTESRRVRKNGRKTSNASPSLTAETKALSRPARGPLVNPKENAHIRETTIKYSMEGYDDGTKREDSVEKPPAIKCITAVWDVGCDVLT